MSAKIKVEYKTTYYDNNAVCFSVNDVIDWIEYNTGYIVWFKMVDDKLTVSGILTHNHIVWGHVPIEQMPAKYRRLDG